MCKVDLSDVTANSVFDGLIAIENIVAGSKPRRYSAIFEHVDVAYSRIKVPYNLSL